MPKKLKAARDAPGALAGDAARAKARAHPADPKPERKRAGKTAVKGKGKVGGKGVARGVADTAVARGLGGLRRELGKLARRRTSLDALGRLELAIEEVQLGGRDSPRTRRLLAAGVPKMAQKVIEEAGETAIEALRGDPAALVNETADLFYNVMVLLSASGIPIAAVWREMARREVAIGMAEKLPKAMDLDG